MNIAVIGTGYVGLSTGVCLSEIGHQVVCIDVDEEKINFLQKGISPIYEPGIEDLIIKNSAVGRLRFTTSHQKAIKNADVIIISVGTPQNENGKASLTYLVQAAIDIAPFLQNNVIIVLKSTVPVGTNDYIKSIIQDHCHKEISFQMASNPEFLRQGSAIKDTFHADRIVIGADNPETANKIKEMYGPINAPTILTSIRSAEMIKCASNAFLATKISFINEVANLCEQVGSNVEDVATGMGMDQRIGASFLQPGIGFGGSCFPKDVKALLNIAKDNGIAFSILQETLSINENQQKVLVEKAIKRFGSLQGKKIALLGLSFKPETDDMREAPSIKISNLLMEHGATVSAYDPVAINNAKKVLNNKVIYHVSILNAVENADALFIVTEWKEFKQLDLETITKSMKTPIIYDGRNCLSLDRLIACPKIEYYPIGKTPIIIK